MYTLTTHASVTSQPLRLFVSGNYHPYWILATHTYFNSKVLSHFLTWVFYVPQTLHSSRFVLVFNLGTTT